MCIYCNKGKNKLTSKTIGVYKKHTMFQSYCTSCYSRTPLRETTEEVEKDLYQMERINNILEDGMY
jgi:hypothetical protein